MGTDTIWEYRLTEENCEHVVTFAEKPLHWEDSPVVINPYRLNGYDAEDIGAVIADALNVHEDTGLTASQLQARVVELEAALSGVVEFFQPHAWGSGDNRADALREARKALGVE